MKLCEIKGEKALEVIANLIDPISDMLKDPELRPIVQSGNRSDIIKHILLNHKRNVITILALINGENPDTYEPTLLSLPIMLMDLFDDPDVMRLFGLQAQSKESASSGPATENIEA